MQAQTYQCLTHKLPLDGEGFTQSFNINDFDPKAVAEFYQKFGLVIFDGVLNEKEIELSVDDLWKDVIEMSQGTVKRDDPSTWEFPGMLGRFGFVNDKANSQPQLWQNRRHPNVYKIFRRMYEITSNESLSEPLLALYDRGSMMRPSKINKNWKSSPIYHFDIHPWWWTDVVKDPKSSWRRENVYNEKFKYWLGEGNYVPKVRNFTRFQGVLALSKTGPGTGGFQCVCSFQNCIKDWCIKYPEGTRITRSLELMQNMQQCYQRAGSLLIFSRELPHNIFPNESEHFRYAQYLRMAPESTLMLTAEDKAVRKREVKKMLPAYLDVNNDLCREIFMLDEDETSQQQKKVLSNLI